MKDYLFAAAAAAFVASFGFSAALGKPLIIDGGPVTYLTSGDGWLYNKVDLRQNAQCDLAGGPCAIPIGFPINFGQGPVDHLYISENGIVTFGAPLRNGHDARLPLASIRAPYIAALYVDMVSTFDVEDGLGEITWGPGRIDPAEDPDLKNDTSPKTWFEGDKAFKIDWVGVARMQNPTDNDCFAQIVIYDRGNGDFDLQLNYGITEPAIMPLNGAEVGFRLGSNVFRFNGAAIDNSRDMIFRFRNGAYIGVN